MKFNQLSKLLFLLLYTFGISNFDLTDSKKPTSNLVDQKATYETQALYENLKKVSKTHIMFGHQDDLAYGVHWKDWHKKKSDVHETCGKFPAVYGWDISKLGASQMNIDSINFSHMKEWMKLVYKKGGINTVSWHLDNLYTGGDSWDVDTMINVVASILPGGSHHHLYIEKLDHLAEFMNDVEVGFFRKKKVPIMLRLFHEHSGSWFWWGNDFCSREEYIELWKFTVQYLRDTKKMHQFLYIYSPDIIDNAEHYLERYPGDEWVDIMGLDDYHDLGSHGKVEDLTTRLRTLVLLAEERGKIAALTETGYESIPDETWWTEKLLSSIKNDKDASKIAWLMVWRNDRPSHHYAPFPEHISAKNFIEFSSDQIMLFENDLPSMYKMPKGK